MTGYRPKGIKEEVLQGGQRIPCPRFSRVKAWVFFLFAVISAMSSARVVRGEWRPEPYLWEPSPQ
jgi:hypothetical protein